MTKITLSADARMVLRQLAMNTWHISDPLPLAKPWRAGFIELVRHRLAERVGNEHAMITEAGRAYLANTGYHARTSADSGERKARV